MIFAKSDIPKEDDISLDILHIMMKVSHLTLLSTNQEEEEEAEDQGKVVKVISDLCWLVTLLCHGRNQRQVQGLRLHS